MVFGHKIWTIPSILSVLHARILDYTAQNIELRYRQPSENEKLGKYSKSMTSRPNTDMQSRDYWNPMISGKPFHNVW